MKVKNIVFDVGNVIVPWNPQLVINQVFPDLDYQQVLNTIRVDWIDLNLGKYTLNESAEIMARKLEVETEKILHLMDALMKDQVPFESTIEILENLQQQNIPLYIISDNIREFIAYHKEHSRFLHFFKKVVISADVGVLKPSPKIYEELLQSEMLQPSHTVFIDDIISNVDGARNLGMHGIHCTGTDSIVKGLQHLGVSL